MKLSFKLAALYRVGLLSNCATLPDTQTATDDARAKELINRIHKALPGTYSNFAQINETSGATQASQWIKPGSERIDLNLEWLTIKLEIAPPGG